MADRAFHAAVADLRPRLHRYAARLTGSVTDGEDVVQEALTHAYDRLETLRDPARIEPWLFRIAHRKALDLLRRRRPEVGWVDEVPGTSDTAATVDVERAIAALVGELPPKERAAVLLKDVLDTPLADIAEIIDSTVGGVKSALHRGRSKLGSAPRRVRPLPPDERALAQAYVARFNARDWDGVCALTRADARLEVVGAGGGIGHEAMREGYFRNYGRLPPWRLGLAWVDGVECIVHYRQRGEEWAPATAVRLTIEGGEVVEIFDYVHVEYQLAGSVVVDYSRNATDCTE